MRVGAVIPQDFSCASARATTSAASLADRPFSISASFATVGFIHRQPHRLPGRRIDLGIGDLQSLKPGFLGENALSEPGLLDRAGKDRALNRGCFGARNRSGYRGDCGRCCRPLAGGKGFPEAEPGEEEGEGPKENSEFGIRNCDFGIGAAGRGHDSRLQATFCASGVSRLGKSVPFPHILGGLKPTVLRNPPVIRIDLANQSTTQTAHVNRLARWRDHGD